MIWSWSRPICCCMSEICADSVDPRAISIADHFFESIWFLYCEKFDQVTAKSQINRIPIASKAYLGNFLRLQRFILPVGTPSKWFWRKIERTYAAHTDSFSIAISMLIKCCLLSSFWLAMFTYRPCIFRSCTTNRCMWPEEVKLEHYGWFASGASQTTSNDISFNRQIEWHDT